MLGGFCCSVYFGGQALEMVSAYNLNRKLLWLIKPKKPLKTGSL